MTSTYSPTQPRQSYPSDASAMVDVSPADRLHWQAALDDGHEAVISVDQRRTVRSVGVTMTAFVVTGRDEPGVGHGVCVARDSSNGNVHTLCSCDAGRDARPCWHAALAIDELDAWPGYVAVQSYQRPVMTDDEPRCPACGGEVWQSQKLMMPRGYVGRWRCRCGWTAEVPS